MKRFTYPADPVDRPVMVEPLGDRSGRYSNKNREMIPDAFLAQIHGKFVLDCAKNSVHDRKYNTLPAMIAHSDVHSLTRTVFTVLFQQGLIQQSSFCNWEAIFDDNC